MIYINVNVGLPENMIKVYVHVYTLHKSYISTGHE